MLKNSELRALTRKQLGGNIFSAKWFSVLDVFLVWLATFYMLSFLYAFIAEVAVLMEAMFLAAPPSAPTLIAIWILELFTIPVLTYGIYRMSIVFVREGRASVGATFSGFAHFFRVFWWYVVQNFFLILWTVLFIVPGIIKSYSYAMAPYIRQDNWKKSACECITESRLLMKGKKWKLFCLDFSFVGWYLLGALCFGIGVIFVYPYHLVARANFYEELVKSHRPENSAISIH